MDGNGRWATCQGLARLVGHQRGVEAAERAVRGCYRRRIDHLTLFTFSMANWHRPATEVAGLMALCGEFAVSHRAEYVERGIAVRVIGDLGYLPTAVRREVDATVHATRHGQRLVVTLALSYSSRHDLVGAARTIAARVRSGMLAPEEIDCAVLQQFMSTSTMPDPDLLIRTGGERRLSDFLLYESANAELFFSDIMWPDFDEQVLDEALDCFARRQRRFGLTEQQLALGA